MVKQFSQLPEVSKERNTSAISYLKIREGLLEGEFQIINSYEDRQRYETLSELPLQF
jgi:hypothetical protein